MKKYTAILLILFITTIHHATTVRPRVQVNQLKGSLEELLSDMGVSSVTSAKKKINQLNKLLSATKTKDIDQLSIKIDSLSKEYTNLQLRNKELEEKNKTLQHQHDELSQELHIVDSFKKQSKKLYKILQTLIDTSAN